jgi:hypothetical protein
MTTLRFSTFTCGYLVATPFNAVGWIFSYCHDRYTLTQVYWSIFPCDFQLWRFLASWRTKALSKASSLYSFKTAVSNSDVVVDYIFKHGCNGKLESLVLVRNRLLIKTWHVNKCTLCLSKILLPILEQHHHTSEPRFGRASRYITIVAVTIAVVHISGPPLLLPCSNQVFSSR